MSDKATWEPQSTTLVLLKSSYLIAEYIADGQVPSDKPDSTVARMRNALEANYTNLDLAVFGQAGTFAQPTLEDLCAALSNEEKFGLLVELRVANPFYPFEFQMTKSRDKLRLEQMRQIALRELHMTRQSATIVDEALRAVTRAQKKKSPMERIAALDVKDWALIIGGGALLASAAVVAAPLIAVAMPAAAGLSGAAAVSAGLASLGGGSLAAGGLGMAGGMWALGVSGATVGALASATASVLAQGSGPGLIQAEVMKLCVSFELARTGHIDRSISEFEIALDRWHTEISDVVRLERSRNEEKSQRLKDLDALEQTMTFAGEFMSSRQAPGD